jgi:hypothetical protein
MNPQLKRQIADAREKCSEMTTGPFLDMMESFGDMTTAAGDFTNAARLTMQSATLAVEFLEDNHARLSKATSEDNDIHGYLLGKVELLEQENKELKAKV